MTERNFPDFLTAFETYARDGYTPEDFNTWTGISIIAAALERKVWFQWNQTLFFYPNMFVMLVSLPAGGKSTALNRGVDILSALQKSGHVKFLPNQASEAYFNESVARSKSFFVVPSGHQQMQTSAFFYASEASDCLKEVYGDITSTMTNLYDCPRFWKKGTKKDGELIVENACLNILAGSTFDFLGKLITDSNIMGGFASRLTYVISKEEKLRDTSFPHGYADLDGVQKAIEENLVADLRRINEMSGPFSASAEFGVAWQEWDKEMQARRHSIESEKLKSLLARMSTSMMKLCIIISASESSSRHLEIRHFEKAKALLWETERQLPGIFRESRAANNTTADGLKSATILAFVKKGNMTKAALSQSLMLAGFESFKVETSITGFVNNGILGKTHDGELELLIDPNKYF